MSSGAFYINFVCKCVSSNKHKTRLTGLKLLEHATKLIVIVTDACTHTMWMEQVACELVSYVYCILIEYVCTCCGKCQHNIVEMCDTDQCCYSDAWLAC